MDQERTVNKILYEMEWNGMFLPEHKAGVRTYLQQAYAAGFDKGRRTFGPTKSVMKFSKTGEFIEAYSSLRQASKANNIQSSNISAAAHGRRQLAGGFYWRIAD